MSDDRHRWDNNDWHEGMTLPSRKDKHRGKGKKRAKRSDQRLAQADPAEAKPQTSVEALREAREIPLEARAISAVAEFSASHEALEQPAAMSVNSPAEPAVADHPALQEIQQARAEATAASAGGLAVEDVSWLEREALLDDRRHHEQKAAGDDVDPPPFFTTWQRVLLWTGTVLVLVVVLAWGKLGYVHNVPDLVRQNVSAYDSNPAFLVLKPWWFGPPVIDLAQYNRESETPSWDLYHARLGDYAGIVDHPHVLWYFQEDKLRE